MCGRFTYRVTWPELVRLYRLTLDAPARNIQPRYNICPTTNIDAVIEREGERELLPMRWGLVPSWWPKPLKEMRVATFNARAEAVARKPTFRDAFKRTRCLIPASGYYEWQDTADGKHGETPRHPCCCWCWPNSANEQPPLLARNERRRLPEARRTQPAGHNQALLDAKSSAMTRAGRRRQFPPCPNSYGRPSSWPPRCFTLSTHLL
jgi:hypothetical protein